MESFNKNWLAILLIVFAFTAIGFLFGWTLKPCHHDFNHFKSSIHDKDVFFEQFDGTEPFQIPLDAADLDSLKDVKVKVWVEKDGDVITCKGDSDAKVIVKKIIVKE